MESPFGPMDALYTRALMSSSKSRLAFIWLGAHQIITAVPEVQLSGWLFNCLCETSTGEAQLVLGALPSLIQIPRSMGESYTFYHKSFLDFLEDPRRCKSFADLGEQDILPWICERFGRILTCEFVFR